MVSKPLASSVLGTRSFATEKQLKLRMTTIGNIKKITSAMKMVASARLRKSEEELQKSKLFTESMSGVVPMLTAEQNAELLGKESTRTMVAAIACDRGLCGGMNSSIVRDVKKKADGYEEANVDWGLMTFGEKGRSGLERVYGKRMAFAITESGKNIALNFKQVCELTDAVQTEEYDTLRVVANSFRNMISFDTFTHDYLNAQYMDAAFSEHLIPYKKVAGAGEFYDNLHSFRLATLLWGHFAQAATVELSARVNAMENSSKNAGEMLDKITLLYNSKRQGRITTELIEIISGASALEEAK
jgi:F-type H+-transporting ATPase subunit gamma